MEQTVSLSPSGYQPPPAAKKQVTVYPGERDEESGGEQLSDVDTALAEVMDFLFQAVAYIFLTIVISATGFVTALEFMAQPMLIRKLTCVQDWDYISRSCVPSITLFANMFGSVLGGIIVDKVGRRPTLLVSSFIALMAELVCMVSIDKTIYLGTRVLFSLCMGTLHITTLLYSVESLPSRHRLHPYFLHSVAQSISLIILPMILEQSPFNEVLNIWNVLSTSIAVILALVFLIGVIFPEPPLSRKARGTNHVQSKWSLIPLETEDVVEPEPHFAHYTDMFYSGGKVSGCILLILYFSTSLLSTNILLSFPILYDAGSACLADATDPPPRPCMGDIVTLNNTVFILGCALVGVVMGYISVQRYGRKNSLRGSAALRVVVIISLVLCSTTNFLFAQLGAIVVFTYIFIFSIDIYTLELYATRSRGASFGLLQGMRLLGAAVAFLINMGVNAYVQTELKLSIVTVVGSLVFGCTLGLRKETYIMALNIGHATVDVGL